MEETAWLTLRGWMGKIREAISAYDQADIEYVSVCNFQQKSMLLGGELDVTTSTSTATPSTMTTINQRDTDFALRCEVLETARNVVEVTCEGYVSLLHQLFEDYKKKYETDCILPTAMDTNTEDNTRITTDRSLLDEQRRIMFQDAEVHFENAIARHKIRLDREKANDNQEMKNALDCSAKVVDAVEKMKIRVSVDWWTFLREMDRLIQINKSRDHEDIGNYDSSTHDGDEGSETYMDQLYAYFEGASFDDDIDGYGGTLPV